jgi:hypothetical protein
MSAVSLASPAASLLPQGNGCGLPLTGGPKNRAKVLATVVISRRIEGLTGIGLLWAMYKHRIQLLKDWVHPIFEYLDRGNLTRESANKLPEGEIRDRVMSIMVRNVEVDIGHNP